MDPARTATLGAWSRVRTGTVPTFTVIRSTKEEPNSVPAASPRLPRSPSPWPPGPTSASQPGSSPSRRSRTSAHRARPISARLEPVYLSKDVITLVPRVLLFVTLAEPAPSGSPGYVSALSGLLPPSPAPPGSGCPQLHRPCCDRSGGEGLSPPLKSSAPRGARGLRYSPTTSTDLGVQLGVGGELERLRFPRFHPVTLARSAATVEASTPQPRSASSRDDQCVTPSLSGGGVNVAAKILARSTVRGRPDRCSSSNPCHTPPAYRDRHRFTVGRATPTRSAISVVGHPVGGQQHD